MKKIIFFILFIISFNLSAAPVNLLITTTEDYSFEFETDDNIKIFTITQSLLPSQNNDTIYGIKKIEGFNQMKNLEIIRIKNIDLIDDFSFLFDIENLHELYISTTIMTDFSFIEKLKNLELMDLEPFIYDEDLETLRNIKINLESLENLKAIIFSTTILTIDDYYEEFNCIPKFINVKNKPYLDIGNNGIQKVSDSDLEILSQFSEINLYPNPIINDWMEMDKLKELHVISR